MQQTLTEPNVLISRSQDKIRKLK